MKWYKLLYSRYPVLSLTILYVMLPVVVALASIYFYLANSVPAEGQPLFRGGSLIEVIVNDQVVTISAGNDLDAYYALGFRHATDRLWQMEMTRRMVSGRLAEVVGSSSLELDKLMRTIGLYPLSTDSWDDLPVNVKEEVISYTKGVNEAIQNLNTLPVEFLYYRIKPEPWREVDSVATYSLMAWMMSKNFSEEIYRQSLVDTFGRRRAEDFMLGVDEKYRSLISVDNLEVADDVHKKIDSFFDPFVQLKGILGSNNWVVSGEFSETGSPMLASDPHLNLAAPSSWYVAHLVGDSLNFIGSTFPGFPYFIMGRNEDIAWGITNMGADVQDLRVEKIASDGSSTYKKDGKRLKLELREEEIIVRQDALRAAIKPIKITVRKTENGPLLSDVVGGVSGLDFSVSWVGYEGLTGSISALSSMPHAADWSTFKGALRDFEVPSQNFVFADKNGNIAYQAAGKIPIRKGGVGAFPSPGWTTNFDWSGWIDFDELPSQYNPERGYIVTANNNVLPEAYPYFISIDWAPSYRKDRISYVLEEKIKSGKKLSLTDMKVLQLDTVSLAARELLPILMHNLDGVSSGVDEYIAVLSNWDGDMAKDSSAAALFQVWIRTLHRIILSDEKDFRSMSPTDSYYYELLLMNPDYNFLTKVLSNDQFSWCDDRATEGIKETCSQIVAKAFLFAIEDLQMRLGSVDEWSWGGIHRKHFPHVPFSRCEFSPFYPCGENRYLHSLFHISTPSGGDEYTVDVAPASGMGGIGKYQQFWGASYRQVLDLSDMGCSEFYLAPGRSGNVMAKSYEESSDWSLASSSNSCVAKQAGL